MTLRFLTLICALALAGCEGVPNDLTNVEDVSFAPGTETAKVVEEADADVRVATTPPADAPRNGFLAMFTGRASTKATGGSAPEAADFRAESASVRTTRSTGGLFGLRPAPEAGLILTPVCDVSVRDLGKVIATDRSGFKLHDPIPAATATRTMYLTGFSDGCPRAFQAGLAMFGDPEFHEFVRYSTPENVLPYSATDTAYESLKRRLCGVRRGTPCGRSMSRLERSTAFLTIYPRAAPSQRQWAEVLLHDGRVVAEAKEGG